MAALPYLTFDADNHHYEPVDCFTRHMPRDQAALAFQLADIGGEMQPVVDGRPVTVMFTGWFHHRGNRPTRLAARDRAGHQAGRHVGQWRVPLVAPIDLAALQRDARIEAMDRQGVEAMMLFPSTAITVEPAFNFDPVVTWANYRAFDRWLEEDWGLGARGRNHCSNRADPTVAAGARRALPGCRT